MLGEILDTTRPWIQCSLYSLLSPPNPEVVTSVNTNRNQHFKATSVVLLICTCLQEPRHFNISNILGSTLSQTPTQVK